ncbi:hypothetical protein RCL1_001788 [Eukaryota sp. TZLM3-RCL]
MGWNEETSDPSPSAPSHGATGLGYELPTISSAISFSNDIYANIKSINVSDSDSDDNSEVVPVKSLPTHRYRYQRRINAKDVSNYSKEQLSQILGIIPSTEVKKKEKKETETKKELIEPEPEPSVEKSDRKRRKSDGSKKKKKSKKNED